MENINEIEILKSTDQLVVEYLTLGLSEYFLIIRFSSIFAFFPGLLHNWCISSWVQHMQKNIRLVCLMWHVLFPKKQSLIRNLIEGILSISALGITSGKRKETWIQHRKKMGCNSVSTKGSANHEGRNETERAIQKCPALGWKTKPTSTYLNQSLHEGHAGKKVCPWVKWPPQRRQFQREIGGYLTEVL